MTDQNAKFGRENRGKRAGSTEAGEATGSGAGAGGSGNPEEIDSSDAGGGGTIPYPGDAKPRDPA